MFLPYRTRREKKVEAERVQEPVFGVLRGGEVEKVVVVLVLAVDKPTVESVDVVQGVVALGRAAQLKGDQQVEWYAQLAPFP